VAPPVFKTGLAANIVAGGFDSLPPPPIGVRHSPVLCGDFRFDHPWQFLGGPGRISADQGGQEGQNRGPARFLMPS
jgi:hypothetical protein